MMSLRTLAPSLVARFAGVMLAVIMVVVVVTSVVLAAVVVETLY